ncbi:ABC transporter ATP-binding protein [Alicyclobacillus sp. ALC3]|nr:ABC transporter ATP-binding protein [Alicyclobacillus sp. ALC3]
MVSFQNVSKRYQLKEAVRHLSFDLPTGMVIGLIGPNGSGKTTTLKLMTGLLHPNDGQVLFQNKRINRMMARQVSYLSDTGAVYGFYTVRQMVNYYAGIYADFNVAKATEMLTFMQLDGNQRVRTLSKGNLGRLKIVLAVSRQVPLIVMDEPLSGLDPLVRQSILKGLISFIDLENQTVVLSTHEVDEVEPLLDMAVLLNHGEVSAMDYTDHIRETFGGSIVEWMKQVLV